MTVTDNVYQPFEPEIDWSEFSVAVLESDIPRLADRLAAINASQLLAMQRRLYCGAQHVFWSSIFGAIVGETGHFDAFETTLEILRMKRQYPGSSRHSTLSGTPHSGAS